MGRRKRRRVDPTREWQQIELLCAWDDLAAAQRRREPRPTEPGSALAREGHAQPQGDQHAAREPPDHPGEPQAAL